MVIQIQFRYSQHTHLQEKKKKEERLIDQVDRMVHRKDALSFEFTYFFLKILQVNPHFTHAHVSCTFPLSVPAKGERGGGGG